MRRQRGGVFSHVSVGVATVTGAGGGLVASGRTNTLFSGPIGCGPLPRQISGAVGTDGWSILAGVDPLDRGDEGAAGDLSHRRFSLPMARLSRGDGLRGFDHEGPVDQIYFRGPFIGEGGPTPATIPVIFITIGFRARGPVIYFEVRAPLHGDPANGDSDANGRVGPRGSPIELAGN